MKTAFSLVALFGLLSLRAADAPKVDLPQAIERHASALVVVEYELQYDDADAPVGGLGAER